MPKHYGGIIPTGVSNVHVCTNAVYSHLTFFGWPERIGFDSICFNYWRMGRMWGIDVVLN